MTPRLPAIELNAPVKEQIFGDALEAVTELLDGYYQSIDEENGDPHGRVKFELSYIAQELRKGTLSVPCYANRVFTPSTLTYAVVEALHPRGSCEHKLLGQILHHIDFGCRRVTPQRIEAALGVIDWFIAHFVRDQTFADASPETKFLEDLGKIKARIVTGESLPPFPRTEYSHYDYGPQLRLRAYDRPGNSPFLAEAYPRLGELIDAGMIPLMYYDSVGDRTIFIYVLVGRIDPLNPPIDMRVLEYAPVE